MGYEIRNESDVERFAIEADAYEESLHQQPTLDQILDEIEGLGWKWVLQYQDDYAEPCHLGVWGRDRDGLSATGNTRIAAAAEVLKKIREETNS